MSRSPPVARIGAHAIILVADVLRDRLCASFADAVLRDATHYSLECLPRAMIDEREVRAVVRALVQRLGAPAATAVLREAGRRTADYVIDNHIPIASQLVLRVAPRRVSLALLLQAMQANAWTFVGSGQFAVATVDGAPQLVVRECAMCRGMHERQPMCDYYAGSFERLLSVLVAPGARVEEVACMAQGADACRFALLGLPALPPPPRAQSAALTQAAGKE